MFRTFAQFLFQMKFSRVAGGSAKYFWKFRRGGGLFFFYLKKMKIPERWGVLSEIPSVVGV